MPTGTLPASGKKLWEEVYNKALKGSCKSASDPEKCAAGSAWKAVENAGWHKGKDGKWTKKARIEEFSIRIERAAYDKATNEMRWRASGSDTDDDIRQDNMSLELFSDFLGRIGTGELVPEEYRSNFWSGGMPYLSISHYGDYDGEAVPGTIDEIYVDGSILKGKGKFHDTPLGQACFKAVNNDLYGKNKESDNKVRISIGFLDYSHIHKSTGYVFVRESLEDICPECLLDIIRGEYSGRKFMKGHLIHWAMTRVPINQRTNMEIEKAEVDESMTTRKEDAASIVGQELADELEELASKKEVMRSDVLITRSEDEPEDESECDEDDEDCKEKMKKAKEEKADLEANSLIEAHDSMPLEYSRPYGGATSLKEIKAQQEARKEQWRVSDLWWATQAAIENILSYDGDVKGKSKQVSSVMEEFKDMLGSGESIFMAQIMESFGTSLSGNTETVLHPLDGVFEGFKSVFDEVCRSDNSKDDKLRMLQEPFNEIAFAIKKSINDVSDQEQPSQPSSPPADSNASDIVNALSNVMKPIADRLDLLIQQQSSLEKKSSQIPNRRSIQPTLAMQSDIRQPEAPKSPSQTPKLRAIIDRST